MAVEKVKSDLYRKELTGGAIPAALKDHGRLHTAIGTVVHDAAASAGSTYKLAEVPSYAVLHWDTIFEAANWKFTDLRIGTKDDITALVNTTVAAATTQAPISKLDANHGKALWEVLGLPSDPGGMISIYVHAIGAAFAAGSMKFIIQWIDN